ncbi:MAG: tetratricopeptide repeat protein, partial [Saccharothrix sp.]|nr:tetratricopeptide repeat protein [Saccharothrix sp.]
MDNGAEPPPVTATSGIAGFQHAYRAVGGTGLPQKGGQTVDRRPFTTEPPLDLLPAAFQGRDDLKPDLVSALTPRRRGLRVLHGIAGGGKSSLALWLARQARDQGRPVYWVGNGDVEQSMHAVAVRRGVDIGQVGRADAHDVVWRSLESATEPWLLVFDNVDDVDQRGVLGSTGAHLDGTGWIRPSRAGLVVVTSRRGDRSTWGEDAELTRVNCLDGEDGARVLLGFAPDAGPPGDARLLADRLGGLPLALRLAGHYLANDPPRHRTFADYRRAIQDDLDLLDAGEPTPATLLDDDSARLSIRLTWELSLSLLEERRLGAARPLLHLLACYGAPHPIPADLLVAEHLHGTPVDPDGTLTDGRLTQLIKGLVSSALADQTVLLDTPHLALHPLLAEVIAAARDASPHADDTWTAAVTLLAEVGPDDNDPAAWAAWTALPAVVTAVLNRVPEHLEVLAEAVEGGNLCATYLVRTGAIHASHDMSALALRRASALHPRHPVRMTARLAAAIVGKTEGNTVVRDELAALHDEASEELEPDHDFLVVVRQHLAESLWLSGDFADAEDIYLDLLADHERGVAPDQEIATRFGYGRMMSTRGHFDIAEREITAVLEAERATFADPDHPEVLLTRAILADVWLAKGELVKARDELEHVLRVQERLHGPDSPLTLSARVTLMAVHAQLRDRGGAEIQLNQLLRIQRDALNPEHPMALLGLAALINTRAADPSVEADPRTDEQRLTEVAAAMARQMGDDHPFVLSTLFGAALQRYRYDKPGGISAVETVLERQVDVLGPRHLGTLNTRLLYAQLLVDMGEDDATAEEELRDLVEAQLASIGPEHPQTTMARTSLANITLRNGDHRGAEELMREAVASLERVHGPDHTDTRETRLALVQLLCLRDAFGEAERELLNLIESLRRTEPDSDEQLAAQVMLALVRMDDGRVEEAERELRQVLASLDGLAEDHRYDRFMVQWFLALVLRHRSADEEAERLLADSVAGLVEMGGYEDDVPNVRMSYAELLHDTGRLHESERELQLVLANSEDEELEEHARWLLSAVLGQLENPAPADTPPALAGPEDRPPAGTPPTESRADPPTESRTWTDYLAGVGRHPDGETTQGIATPPPESTPPTPAATPPPTPAAAPAARRVVPVGHPSRPHTEAVEVAPIESGRDYRQDLRTCAEIAGRLRGLDPSSRALLRHRYGLLLTELGFPTAAYAELAAALAAYRRIGASHWTCLVDQTLARVDDDSPTRIDRTTAEVADAVGPTHRLVLRLRRAAAELRDAREAVAELTDVLAAAEGVERAAAGQALANAVWRTGDRERAEALHTDAVRVYE